MKKDIKLANLKDEYIEYFTDVPIQKYAAQFIMRDEDTIIRWKAADQDFADRVKKAEADFLRKKMINVKAEFAVERLFKQAFAYREEIEIIEPLPKHGTGTTTELRKKFVQMIKDDIKRSKPPADS